MAGWLGNGSFAFTYVFIPNTTISSSQMNTNFADAVTGFGNCVTRDGQGAMSVPFKIVAGSLAAPGLAFGNDTDTGLFRVGANVQALVAGGSNILEISTTGVDLTGDLDVSGALTIGSLVTGAISGTVITASDSVVNASGTVSLPSYIFAGDLDSGIYRIGANNLALAVNATKILEIATTGIGVTGTINSSGFITSTTGAFFVDPTAVFAYNAGQPVLGFDTGDQFEYDRTGNSLFLKLGGSIVFTFNAVAITVVPKIIAPNTAKAFAFFTQSGTTVTFTAANWFNIASVTRTGTGTYTIAFTSNLPTANYTIVGYGQAAGGGFLFANGSSLATSGFTLTAAAATTGVATDVGIGFSFEIFGF